MKNVSVLGLGLLIIAGCVTERPVLYPNAYIRRVGAVTAERDVDDCMRRAEDYVAGRARPEGIAEETITGLAGMSHKPIDDFTGRYNPTPLFRGFANRCLREKGYEPIDWN